MSGPFPLKRPHIYSLELTPVCNNRCPGCSNVFARQKAPLSAKQWEWILDRITPGARVLKITGGEPTLHPEFECILKAIDNRKVSFTLFTNARWHQPDHIITLLQKVRHCNGLLVSLHGVDAGSHEAFTQVAGSFQQACENITHATRAGLRIHTSTVLNTKNYNHIREIVEFSQSLGAQAAIFNRYLGAPRPDLDVSVLQLQWAVAQIEQLRRKNKGADSFQVRYGNCIPQCFMPSGSSGCWAGIAYCTIDPWGRVRPCNHSPTVLGSLFEYSIEELWKSEAMRSWRNLSAPACNQCTQIDVCHGGCRALAEILTSGGDPLVSEPCTRFDTTHLRFFSGSKPILRCDLENESFGYALIRGQSILPISASASPILEQLDGQHTLKEIQEKFGEQALELVGAIIHHGFAIVK